MSPTAAMRVPIRAVDAHPTRPTDRESIAFIIASIARTRPVHTSPLSATTGSDDLTGSLIVDPTSGDLAKTPGAASSGMAGAVPTHVVDPPIRVPTQANTAIGGRRIPGAISKAAMASVKRQKTIGLRS